MDNLEQVLAHAESGDVFWFDKHMDVVTQAREELDAAKRLRELTEWRPIADAPKDGSWFLGGWNHKDLGWMWGKLRYYKSKNVGAFVNSQDEIMTPTHFLPIPEPPQGTK